MKELLVLLGKRVHDLRVAKKWSQEEFADVAGLHRTYVGQIERGEKNLSFANLLRISAALDVTPSGLLSVLDADTEHKNLDSKPATSTDVRDAARRLREIQKLPTRLTHQRDAMNQTMASLGTIAASRPASGASARAKRKPTRK